MERNELRALGPIQDRIWRLITDPEGVEAALAAQGDAGRSGLAALVRADRDLAPVDRVAVYANAYFARIRDCLGDDFGALARALGGPGFHDLVKTYLVMHPPTRPSLQHAGEHLAKHLATEPFASIFARRCAYASDLARLEWALAEAFYAADSDVLTREDLARVPAAAWAELRFEVTPSLRLLTCAWPVHLVRERFESEDPEAVWAGAPSLVPDPTDLRVWRQGERVRYRAIRPIEREALAKAMAAEPFATICGCIPESGEGEAASRAAALISSWISEGLLARSY